jgi:hypothetical protein
MFSGKMILKIGILISSLALAITGTASGAHKAHPCHPDHPLEPGASFDWSAQPQYIIQGTGTTFVGTTNVGSVPVTFVIDPPNKRISLITGDQKQIILANETFIINSVPPTVPNPPSCTRVLKADGTNFTFDDQVAGYLNVISMPGSTIKHPTYFSLASDAATCQGKLSVSITLEDGFFSKFFFAELLPLGTCATVTGIIVFDPTTIDTSSPLDPYFVIDSDCTASSPNWCDVVYPPGNPCGNCR